MSMGSVGATVGGASKAVLVAIDGSGNLAPAHVLVDVSGTLVGTSTNPLIIAELPYQGVAAMTVGTSVTAGRAIRIICTTAGNVSLTYADGSTDIVPINVGLSYIAGAIIRVNSSGTTASATYAAMK